MLRLSLNQLNFVSQAFSLLDQLLHLTLQIGMCRQLTPLHFLHRRLVIEEIVIAGVVMRQVLHVR